MYTIRYSRFLNPIRLLNILVGKHKTPFFSGYSLMQLIVVLGIVAILLGLSIYGLSASQMSARDQERRFSAGRISEEIDAYYRANAALPSTSNLTFEWQGTLVSIGDRFVELKGFLQYSPSSTDISRTQYKYLKSSSGYKLCVLLESGDWYGTGNSQTLECD